jgi:glycosyltransferase involved in cell wall biosynthesis
MRQCAARFAGLAAVSQAVAEACRSARYRCPVRVVRNGLGDRPSSRSADPQVRIGFLAMHTPWKGFNVVARWVRPLAGENVRWLFYGDPAPESQAQVRALQAEFGPAVSLRGHQPATVIFDEIDVLVHASVEFDPLPTVLVEAARAGIPAVASCLGGAPEIVVDGRTGFLFDPSNDTAGCERVRELVRTPERRESMGRRARSRFESDFPLDRMLLAYRAFWTDLLGAPS